MENDKAYMPPKAVRRAIKLLKKERKCWRCHSRAFVCSANPKMTLSGYPADIISPDSRKPNIGRRCLAATIAANTRGNRHKNGWVC